ncbi:hypothetical protein H072_212 [Dactylellina haptotyla CBS 200.50]|uniref:Zn(2)-C6 fungal-type domain-containing protein n=1 Tax=Dactylellina haptotyla (strain CBS 200.50) TaxID=1284197 RepID=S8AS71_DACHA|nr:hypothetical protein H072_212 [Dactylellina haptotyla CBS 200.50]
MGHNMGNMLPKLGNGKPVPSVSAWACCTSTLTNPRPWFTSLVTAIPSGQSEAGGPLFALPGRPPISRLEPPVDRFTDHPLGKEIRNGLQQRAIQTIIDPAKGFTPRSPNKRVSTACGSCKKAKCKVNQNLPDSRNQFIVAHRIFKCSGPPAPCETCRKKKRECGFEVALDGRRKESADVALETVQSKHQALESLFNCLRSQDDEIVGSLVEAIRKGTTLPELGKLVEQQEKTGFDIAEEESFAGPSNPGKHRA